jgi:tRNA pseudouridine38-40 synthase
LSTFRLEIEYDGTGFRGWATQPGMRTVQGELEAALATIMGERVPLTVAGRTDAGVHAWGQVASFRTEAEPPRGLALRLNALGPDDLAVLRADPAPEDFDARRDARSRTYCYRVLRRRSPSPFEQGRALWWPHRLDLAAIEACAASLHGTHDFTAFTPARNEHVRFRRDVLRAGWVEESDAVVSLWIEADAFMHNMVRILVGTMLEAGSGRRSVAEFAALLEGRPREDAGETAPAHGLYLASVAY